MNTRKDDPAKPAPGGDASSSRPHATLDLKATVVDPPATKTEKPAAAAPDATKASASALPGASPRGEAGAAKPEPKKEAPAHAGGYGGIF
jgi:hypothetical protein